MTGAPAEKGMQTLWAYLCGRATEVHGACLVASKMAASSSKASQKKREEYSLRVVRELISQQHNKQCLECHQKGPTYVDMTTLGFICTQCSGYL